MTRLQEIREQWAHRAWLSSQYHATGHMLRYAGKGPFQHYLDKAEHLDEIVNNLRNLHHVMMQNVEPANEDTFTHH